MPYPLHVFLPNLVAALQAALAGVKGNEIKAIAGKLADVESMVALKDLLNRLGSGNMVHEDGGSADVCADIRST